MIEPVRHLSVFSPLKFGNKRIDIIGAGSVGSKVVIELVKLGITNIHVWDFDIVENHNIANQAFGNNDIGKTKVGALAEIVKELTGVDIHIHNEKVDGTQKIGEIVFLLTDTMESRKEIWDKSLKMKLHVKLVIETRMGVSEGRVYAVIPYLPQHVKGWENTLYDDSEAATSACGTSISVGPTSSYISGLAVWQLIKWFNSGKIGMENEILFSINPSMLISNTF